MQTKGNAGGLRILTIILSALILLCLLVMPAMAQEEVETSYFADASAEWIDSEPQAMQENGEEEQEQDTSFEEASTAVLQEDGAQIQPQQETAAAFGFADALPMAYAVDYTSFETAVNAIISSSEKAGTIQLLDSFALLSTVEIPDGITVEVSGKTGDEQLTVDAPASGKRHFLVKGTLSLSQLVVNGELLGGGIRVENGELHLGEGATIYNCRYETDNTFLAYELNGAGVQMLDNSAMYMYEGATVRANSYYHTPNYLGSSYIGGAGIAVQDGSTLYMSGGEIRGNVANGASGTNAHGGGVLLYHGNLVMTGGEIFSNSSHVGAGVSSVVNGVSNVELHNGAIYNNKATDGGGLYIDSSDTASIYEDFTFSGNEAYRKGGAIHTLNDAKLTIYGGLFTQNKVVGHSSITPRDTYGGGVIHHSASNGLLDIRGGEFSYNTSVYHAGAIMTFSNVNYTDTMTIANASFVGNRAAMNGGAIYGWANKTTDPPHYNYKSFTISDTYFESNFAGNGATYYVSDPEIDNLHNARISVSGLSAPFNPGHADSRLTKAYNNFDIYSVLFDPLDYHEVEFYVDGSLWIVRPVLNTSPAGVVDDPTHLYTAASLDGWYTSVAGVGNPSQLYDFTTPVTGPLQLYAVESGPPVVRNNATYYWNYEDTDDATYYIQQDVEENTLLEKPDEPGRTGHAFLGWGQTRQTNAYWDFTTHRMPDTPLALYAQWAVKKYTVTFDYGQMDSGVKREDYDYNSLLEDPGNTFLGYTFEGWRYNGRYWDFAADRMPAQNITLIGVWTQDATTTIPPTTTSPASSSSLPSSSKPASTSKGGGGGTVESSQPPTTTSWAASSSSKASSSIASSTSASSHGTVSAVDSSEPPVSVPEVVDDLAEGNIDATDIPLVWWQRTDGWSLLNTVLSVLLLCSAAFQLLRMVQSKNLRNPSDGHSNSNLKKKKLLWTVLAAATGILPMILLFILEDFGGAMLLLNMYSLWFIGLAVLHAIFTAIAVTMKAKWQQAE